MAHRVPPAVTRESDSCDLGVLLRPPTCAQADLNTAGIATDRALAAEGRTAHADEGAGTWQAWICRFDSPFGRCLLMPNVRRKGLAAGQSP